MSFLLGNKGGHIYNGNIFKCSKCLKQYKTAAGLNKHTCDICELCKRTFSSKQRLKEHKCITVVKVSANISCKDCRKTFRSEAGISKHKCCYCKHCNHIYSSYKRFSDHHCKNPGLHGTPVSDSVRNFTESKCQNVKSKATQAHCLEKAGRDTHIITENSSVSAELMKCVDDAEIPDDIISIVLEIMRENSDGSVTVGQLTPAAMAVALVSGNSRAISIRLNKPCINIHHVSNHWVTSHYQPTNKTVTVYDSLTSENRMTQIKKQLKILYGAYSNTRYISIKQQGTETLCGAFAIASAFCLLLGVPPETQNFDTARMRSHIKTCLTLRKVIFFPTTDDLLSSYFQNETSLAAGKKKQIKTVKKALATTKSSPKRPSSNDRWLYHRKYKQKQRQSASVQKKEREYKRKIRLNPGQLSSEAIKKRKRRIDPRYRAAETAQKRERRQDPAYYAYETEHKREKRQDPTYHAYETEHKRERRQDPAYHAYETEHRRAKRKDQVYETEHKREKRKDPAYQAYEAKHKRERRQDPACQSFETEHRRERRQDPIYQAYEAEQKRQKRQDPAYQVYEAEQKRQKRQDPAYQAYEAGKKRESRLEPRQLAFEVNQKREKRLDPDFKVKENAQRKKNRSESDNKQTEKENDRLRKTMHNISGNEAACAGIRQAIDLFHKLVSETCNYICTCCNQLWFRNSVIEAISVTCDDSNLKRQCILGTKSFDKKEWLCHTCAASLRKKKTPTLSVANGFRFPDKPAVLDLNKLEERLVSPVNVFMQIRELPAGQQQSVHGNVVNVPCDNVATVSSLPRLPEESGTIALKLKRRLRYKSYIMYENVRPRVCLDAVIHLLRKPLFRKYVHDGVSSEWIEKYSQNIQPEDFTNKQDSSQISDGQENEIADDAETTKSDRSLKEVNVEDESETWSEDEDSRDNKQLGSSDTMLYPSSFDDYDGTHSYSVAPSEGNQPVPIFQEDLEELAFPSIFCGEKRSSNKDRKVSVKYSEICKSELRNKDRRVALNVSNIFFKLKKLQIKQIQDRVWLSLKRCKTKGKQYTAGDFKHGNAAEEITKLDDGYKIFRTLRGSPPYWEAAKKDLFAMIRQLGTPTWFFSLSAAETRWPSLLITLGLLLDGKQYSISEIEEMSWSTKSRLIRSDPVTCARHFQHRVDSFIKVILKNNVSPLGKLQDFFYRIEFQQRGSPHIHGLLWIEGAPHIGVDDNQTVAEYISSYITTDRHGSCKEELIKLQCHRHSHSCKKKKQKACRFDFPLPPMRKTKVLEPFRDPTDPAFPLARQNYGKVSKLLTTISAGSQMSFDQFLAEVQLSDEQYILALRTQSEM